MQITISVVLSALAAVITASVAAFAWQRRQTAGAVPVAVFTGAASLWTAGNALQAASVTLSGKLFWVNVQYVGLAVVPLAWFAFACEYTGRERWANRRTLSILAVPMIATVALSWTNQYHHLVRTSSDIVTVGGIVIVRRSFGPVFWLSWTYSNLVNGVGTVLLFHGLVRSHRLYRRQTLAVLTGTTVPWLASFLFYTGLTTVEPEVFVAVSGLAFGYAIAEYDFLDAVPVGRATVFEETDDPVLVLDGDDRIVDANPASRDLFGWGTADTFVGRPIADACGEHTELVERYDDGESGTEVVVEDDGERRYFDVQFSSLSNDSVRGTTVFLRDVTRLKRHERHLERQNEQLEQVGHTIAHDLRNPLNVAQGNLQLARDANDADAVAERLTKVDSAHERIDDIIEEVLAVAKGERTTTCDSLRLRRVAEDAWRNVETEGAEITFDGTDRRVLADEGQLTSAFENLFRNAVEHGSTGIVHRTITPSNTVVPT
ncbi:histidine kinase N-terminal 7TM domain-containing protein [Halorussus sp. MSC15.2]|uniref:histidine kinase N-terminal 7TM domain-containing protein n=1 Tax=Halorussus sp. MSC15.2 TaxID=2283638 RepID=UPI001F0788B2|nr:histidine kinase N-terminal 7TM domain-containing protein [Halorussus sp. MSC15.2]